MAAISSPTASRTPSLRSLETFQRLNLLLIFINQLIQILLILIVIHPLLLPVQRVSVSFMRSHPIIRRCKGCWIQRPIISTALFVLHQIVPLLPHLSILLVPGHPNFERMIHLHRASDVWLWSARSFVGRRGLDVDVFIL